MEKLAIGRVYTDEHGETEIDDSGWTSEMNEVDEGYQLVFGGINVFVGMVSTSGIRSNSAESVSEPTAIVESDGEESVGTSEVDIVAESEEEQNQVEKPGMLQDLSMDPDYDADSESILPLFEDRLGYGIEEEEYAESPVRARVVGVYMSGNGGNQFDPALLTKEINASNAAERAAELASARAALERQLADVTEANRRLAEERARIQAEAQVVRSRREELTSIQHRRARSRLRDGVHINPTNLFTTPNGPGSGAGLGGSAASVGDAGGGPEGSRTNGPPPPPPGGPGGSRTNGPPPEGGVGGGTAGGMGPQPNRFYTPDGHYSNPMDNVYAATLRLENIMVRE